MEFRFDAMLCSTLDNENCDAGYIKFSNGPHLARTFPVPSLKRGCGDSQVFLMCTLFGCKPWSKALQHIKLHPHFPAHLVAFVSLLPTNTQERSFREQKLVIYFLPSGNLLTTIVNLKTTTKARYISQVLSAIEVRVKDSRETWYMTWVNGHHFQQRNRGTGSIVIVLDHGWNSDPNWSVIWSWLAIVYSLHAQPQLQFRHEIGVASCSPPNIDISIEIDWSNAFDRKGEPAYKLG